MLPFLHLISTIVVLLLSFESNFANWQYIMRSRLKSSSVHLWKVVEYGFNPRNPYNMMPTEEINYQLNTTALAILQDALTHEQMTHIRSNETAKDAWNSLERVYLGNKSI